MVPEVTYRRFRKSRLKIGALRAPGILSWHQDGRVMAREWGVELVRTQTVADSAANCDFIWKFPETEAD